MKSLSPLEPRIVFEDTHLVVLAKPAGLLSQGEITGDHNLVDWLRGYFGRHYVGLVHRLDRNTSGLMVVAKRSKSANRLSVALREGRLERVYWAVLQGSLGSPRHWRHCLEKNSDTNVVRVVNTPSPKDGHIQKAKWAELKVSPIQNSRFQGEAICWAEFKLETGRSHQIRVQAAFEGHPLVGDVKYGSQLSDKLKSFGRPALHSAQISFPHPMSKAPLHFEEPLPVDMKRLLDESNKP